MKRSRPTECIYTCTEQQRKDAVDYRPHGRSQHARQRLSRLENLVTELVKAQGSREVVSDDTVLDEKPPDQDSGVGLADSIGKLDLTVDGSTYAASTHWTTILEDVSIIVAISTLFLLC